MHYLSLLDIQDNVVRHIAGDCHFGVCDQIERRVDSSYRDMIGWTWLNLCFSLDSMHQNDNHMRQVHSVRHSLVSNSQLEVDDSQLKEALL